VLHIRLSLKGSAYRKIIVASFARYCGVPCVVHLHGGGFEFFWLTAGARLRRAVDRMFVDSDKIVVLGRYWVDVVAGWLPQTRDKIEVFPNATYSSAVENEPASDRRVRLTFLGELGRRKGTPQLMEALGAWLTATTGQPRSPATAMSRRRVLPRGDWGSRRGSTSRDGSIPTRPVRFCAAVTFWCCRPSSKIFR
jgi:hypothetical protein